MDITINLASQPHQQVQRLMFRWRFIVSAAALLDLVLLCASVSAFLSWRSTQKEAGRLTGQIEELDRQKAAAETFMARPDNRQLRVRAEFLNATIARKTFSWTEVFTDLEHIMPPRLHVTSIHPAINGDDQLELHLMVSGSAREAAIELVRRLEQSPHFADAQIISEAQSPQNGQPDSVQYNITAVYIPAFARTTDREQEAASLAEAQPAESDTGGTDHPKEARSVRH